MKIKGNVGPVADGEKYAAGIKDAKTAKTVGNMQTALSVLSALMPQKKPKESWAMAGASPGSLGTDWYDPTWYA